MVGQQIDGGRDAGATVLRCKLVAAAAGLVVPPASREVATTAWTGPAAREHDPAGSGEWRRAHALPGARALALPAGGAEHGLLVPAEAGPGAVLRTVHAAGPGTAVYVVSAGDAHALQHPAAAGAVVLARLAGATVLEVRGGYGAAVRDFGLARRHRSVSVLAPSGPGTPAAAWAPPAPPSPPARVAVPCRIVAEEPGDRYVIAVGRGAARRLLDRHLVTPAGPGEGLVRCEVVARNGRVLTVDVPGVPLDEALFAELELDAWLQGLVEARAAARLAAAFPTWPAALCAPTSLPIGVLVASKNGARSIADTVRSAAGQAEVYVVSDGSTDDTVAVAAAAGATVLHLERNVGKPAALRTAIDHFGLTRRFAALAILDDDTVVEPDFVDQCRRRLEPGVAIVVGQTMTRWTDEHRWNVWLGSRAYAYWRYQATLRRGQSAFNVMTCISGSNSVYRAELLDQVLVEHTPYIVDDTYWTLETHRRKLGRILYVPEAKAHICDPTTLRDWYKQNLRWMWGSFQGIRGHGVGRHRSFFDFTFVLQILDWLLYVLVAPLLVLVALLRGWVQPDTLATLSLIGYGVGGVVAAAVLRKWRLAAMVPALFVVDWLYRVVFVHAFVKTVRQPRVASCRWDSPARYT